MGKTRFSPDSIILLICSTYKSSQLTCLQRHRPERRGDDRRVPPAVEDGPLQRAQGEQIGHLQEGLQQILRGSLPSRGEVEFSILRLPTLSQTFIVLFYFPHYYLCFSLFDCCFWVIE